MPIKRYCWVLLLLAFELLSGCTAFRIGYRNADTMLAWRADDYFDMDQDQKRDFNARLDALLRWHRYEQLPEYAVFVSTAIDRARDGLKRNDIEWLVEGFEARYRTIVNRGIDDAVALLATVKPEQITTLQKQWDKDNRKFVSENAVGEGPAQRTRARLKRTLNQIDDWTGNLSDEQEQKIATLLEAIPQTSELRHRDRLRRQKEFMELLKLRANPQDLKPRLRAFLANWEDGRHPEYSRLAKEAGEKRIAFYMAVEKLLTPAQRDTVLRRMQNYVDDFKALSVRTTAAVGETRLQP